MSKVVFFILVFLDPCDCNNAEGGSSECSDSRSEASDRTKGDKRGRCDLEV